VTLPITCMNWGRGLFAFRYLHSEDGMAALIDGSAADRDPLAVVKLGGSILTGARAYQRAAAFLRNRLLAAPEERLVAVVSAQKGATDSLERTAKQIVPSPRKQALDLLWSTGELRSVALLALHLQALDVRAIGVNIHQTGLIAPHNSTASGPGNVRLEAKRLTEILADHEVAIVPGFLATDALQSVVSLGRGGSDLTAVLLAAGLGARRCELIKDVPGYFTSDPHRDRNALPVPFLTFEHALELAENGCDLVQRAALEAAARWDLPLVVRSLNEKASVSRIASTIPGATWTDSVANLAVAP
jgi:aspartokinase